MPTDHAGLLACSLKVAERSRQVATTFMIDYFVVQSKSRVESRHALKVGLACAKCRPIPVSSAHVSADYKYTKEADFRAATHTPGALAYF